MSMLDVHADALAKVDEGFHNFLLKFQDSSKYVYGFVEGKDDPSFYKSIIDRFMPDDWQVELIVAGNKKKALAAFSDFDWSRFDQRRIAFFLDRDLDEIVSAYQTRDLNIYYTDGYSIENSFVNRDVFFRLLSEGYAVVDADDQEKRLILNDFDENILIFEKLMMPVMAQIVLWRIAGSTAYLNDCDLGVLFSFENGRLVAKTPYINPDSLVDQFGAAVGAEASDSSERRRIEEVLNTVSWPASLVRGKALLWFLANFLNYTHSTIPLKVAAYERSPKPRQQLGPKTVGFAAAPRSRIPASLRAFLNETFLAYIGAQGRLLN